MLVAQSYLTVCNPMDGSPPGSSVHGMLQARILQWVAIPFTRGSSQPREAATVSLTVLEAGKFKIKVLTDSVCGEGPVLGL